MNSVKEKVRKSIFGKLRSLRNKLNAHGIPCSYSRSVVSGAGFTITYQLSDNGGASLSPKISIRTGEIIEDFDATTFETGLARVRELFRVRGTVTDSPESVCE
jgi:hypothetical protein